MHRFAHVVFAAILVFGAPVRAGELPKHIGYTLYVDGVRVGHSGMKVSRPGGALRFDSVTEVTLGPNEFDLRSHTIVDPKTYRVREFAFEGTKGGMHAAAFMTLAGDSATGWVESAGSDERHRRARAVPDEVVVFEDWIMDLEVVLALHQATRPAGTSEYTLLFANSFLPAEMVAGFTGEASLESHAASMVARRLTVGISGSDPWESMVDPKTGVPVYIHFPGSRTEAFRDDFYGDNPMPRYQPAPEGGSR